MRPRRPAEFPGEWQSQCYSQASHVAPCHWVTQFPSLCSFPHLQGWREGRVGEGHLLIQQTVLGSYHKPNLLPGAGHQPNCPRLIGLSLVSYILFSSWLPWKSTVYNKEKQKEGRWGGKKGGDWETGCTTARYLPPPTVPSLRNP